MLDPAVSSRDMELGTTGLRGISFARASPSLNTRTQPSLATKDRGQATGPKSQLVAAPKKNQGVCARVFHLLTSMWTFRVCGATQHLWCTRYIMVEHA